MLLAYYAAVAAPVRRPRRAGRSAGDTNEKGVIRCLSLSGFLPSGSNIAGQLNVRFCNAVSR